VRKHSAQRQASAAPKKRPRRIGQKKTLHFFRAERAKIKSRCQKDEKKKRRLSRIDYARAVYLAFGDSSADRRGADRRGADRRADVARLIRGMLRALGAEGNSPGRTQAIQRVTLSENDAPGNAAESAAVRVLLVSSNVVRELDRGGLPIGTLVHCDARGCETAVVPYGRPDRAGPSVRNRARGARGVWPNKNTFKAAVGWADVPHGAGAHAEVLRARPTEIDGIRKRRVARAVQAVRARAARLLRGRGRRPDQLQRCGECGERAREA
jgi:hypothetical protein